MFKVIVSPRAWDDFFEIFDYISRDDRDPAERFCEALPNHVELLGTFPQIGVISGRRPTVRSVLHTPIRIYYRVDASRLSISGILRAGIRWSESARESQNGGGKGDACNEMPDFAEAFSNRL